MTRFRGKVSEYLQYAFRTQRSGCIPCRLWHVSLFTRPLNMTPQLADKKKWQDISLKFLYIFEIL